jgi:hypothetical protein
MDEVEFHNTIVKLVSAGSYKISDHALDALLDDELERGDISGSIVDSEVIENYPEFGKGPAILLYQVATDGRIVHCVWGVPKGAATPAVLITAYIPDLNKWDKSLKVRK